jgi:prefoldin subunit 5
MITLKKIIVKIQLNLSLEALHDALSYYYENRPAIDKEISQRKENIRKLSQKFPSKLKLV